MKKRKLLLDSCLPRAVETRLRSDGHDVATLGGVDPGDSVILELAASSGRAIVTIDSDFGTLIFRDGARRVGVLRLLQRQPDAMAQRASELVAAHGDELEMGAFVTDDGDAVRVNTP